MLILRDILQILPMLFINELSKLTLRLKVGNLFELILIIVIELERFRAE